MNQTASQDPSPHHQGRVARLFPLAGAAVLGLTLVGFLEGITEPQAATTSVLSVAQHDIIGDVPNAVAYGKIASAKLSPNANFQSSLKQLRFDKPSVFDAVERTAEMKLAALLDRSRTRAFDGAPPVIPHVVEQQSAANCLACHGEGIRVGNLVASKISHPHYTSCTQCHVESASSGPLADLQSIENEFQGLSRSGPGERAYAGAPPTIPHTLWLRNDCTSCHGLIARPGLRTTHPWLSNCVQCHAASEQLNHLPFAKSQE